MPTDGAYLPVFIVEINGSAVSTAFMDCVRNIEVEQSLHMPAMFQIQLDDPEFTWTDDTALLKVGNAVTIKAKAFGGPNHEPNAAVTLIAAEITAIEPTYPENMITSLVIRGYDKAHRLHRGRKSRTFLQVTDSDIFSRVASECGLTAQVQSTSVVHPYVLQDNQTNWEFLWERARNNGYVVHAEAGKLLCHSLRNAPPSGPSLEYGTILLEFRPRLTWAGQASTVEVRGWDDNRKRAVTSTASPTAWPNATGVRGAPAQPFGASVLGRNAMATTTAHADALADALKSEVEEAKLQAEGLSIGDGNIKPGSTVTLTKLGRRFSGTYLVTSARHQLHSDRSFRTEFAISGFHSGSTFDLLFGGPGAGRFADANDRVTHPGVMPAVVTNLDDPEDRGRVKVMFPWMGKDPNGADIESFWARTASSMGGGTSGFFYLPEVNDEVLVAFENGDAERPYVLGHLWNGRDKPPLAKATAVKTGKVVQRIIRSRLGHVILLDDSDDKASIHFVDKTTKNSIVIDSMTNTISVTAEKDVNVKAKGNVKVEATGNIEAKATGNVKVEATGNLDAKATGNATIESTGPMKVKSAATTTIEGAMIEIKASGIVKIQGSLVQIN